MAPKPTSAAFKPEHGVGLAGGLVNASPVIPQTPAQIAAERFAREVDERFGIPPVGEVRKIIEEALLADGNSRDDGGDNIPGIYNPSGGWKCMRNAFYFFYKYPFEKKASGVMRGGTILEAEIESKLQKKYGRFIKNDFPTMILIVDSGEHYEIEVPYPGDPDPEFRQEGWFYKGKPILLMVRGYSDFYLAGYNGKVRVMWEGKSTFRVGGKKEASEHHVRQLAPYWKASRAQVGRMLYYERNDVLEMKEIEVENDFLEFAFQEAMEWFIEFDGYVKRRELPPAEPKQPHWECRYCPFVDQCKKDGGKPNI